MKVLLTKAFFSSDIEYIKQRLNPSIEIVTPSDFSEDGIAQVAEDVDVLFGGFVSDKILKAASTLKFIQVPWTGIENVNLDLIRKYQIKLCNSHSNSKIVAEHAIALMFDAAKKIAYHDRLMREGNWNRPGINQNTINPFSKSIFGSTVGVIGYGAIGRNIYKMLSGFDCKFLIWDKYMNEKSNVESNITFYSTDETSFEKLSNVNYLFLAIPLTDETKSLVNKDFLSHLNENCIIINTSRGEVIDESDLYKCLLSKQISFAAIDTWYNYPNKEHPLVYPSLKNDFHKLDNIVLSPHRAGFINDSYPHLDDAIENLNRYYEGKELINIVSFDKKF
jgi:D-3-phosphoglycerate dehydrogenase